MANPNPKTDHLPKIPKGKSGNYNGRPKLVVPPLERALAEILSESKDDIDGLKAILMKLRALALKGDVRAAEVLLDRAYGKARQAIDMSGTLTMPTQVLIGIAPPNIQIMLPSNTEGTGDDADDQLPGFPEQKQIEQ